MAYRVGMKREVRVESLHGARLRQLRKSEEKSAAAPCRQACIEDDEEARLAPPMDSSSEDSPSDESQDEPPAQRAVKGKRQGGITTGNRPAKRRKQDPQVHPDTILSSRPSVKDTSKKASSEELFDTGKPARKRGYGGKSAKRNCATDNTQAKGRGKAAPAQKKDTTQTKSPAFVVPPVLKVPVDLGPKFKLPPVPVPIEREKLKETNVNTAGRMTRSKATSRASGDGNWKEASTLKSGDVLQAAKSLGVENHAIVHQVSAASKFKPPSCPPSSVTPSTSGTSTHNGRAVSPLSEFSDDATDAGRDQDQDQDLRVSAELGMTQPCPICEVEVPLSLHIDFADSVYPPRYTQPWVKQKPVKVLPRLTVRQQARFCRLHREESAREEWQKRGYPDIDWTGIPARVQGMQADIEAVIDAGAHDSVFLQRVGKEKEKEEAERTAGNAATAAGGGEEDDVSGHASGAPRSRARRRRVADEVTGSMGAEDVGYYGGRGGRYIGETLVQTFAAKFRAATTTTMGGDGSTYAAIATAGGVTAFVQRVLVPEVVTRLIAQDLGCDVGRAREVLAEGAELGKLLCEEENDELEEEEDDEEGEGEDGRERNEENVLHEDD